MKSLKSIVIFIAMMFFALFSCNAKEAKTNPASDFYFEANKDFTEIIIYRYDGKSPNVVIPSEIEGILVTEIKSFASYMNPTKITSVVIPDTVKKIGKEAFKGCASKIQFAVPKRKQTAYAKLLKGKYGK